MDLLERTADGGMPAGVTVAERRADRLALELLAPEAMVLQLLGMQGLRAEQTEQLEQSTARVCQLFGLPRAPSEYYVKLLAREHGSLPSVRSWLGLS
jgi:Zn-dependent protease with chaperone function